MKSYIRLLTGITGMLVAGVLPLAASSVTYDFAQVTGGTTPVGSPPWLQAVFTDTAANTVQLTVNAGNLAGSEFVSCLYFNLDPGLSPTALSFAVSSTTGTFTSPTVQTGIDGFKAGPDGKFDVLLGFSTAASGSGRFVNGDSITFTITGISGLTANDFNQLSTAAGGSGPYTSAAHIQAIAPDDGSGWVNPASIILNNADTRQPAVPDGSATILLLGASLLSIECIRRAARLSSRALVQVR